MMKTLFLLALCAILATSLQTKTISSAILTGPSAYESRYTIPANSITDTGGSVKFTFTFPKFTGQAPDFTYQVFLASDDSAASSLFTKTAASIGVMATDWTPSVAQAAVQLYVVIKLDSPLLQFQIIEISAQDNGGTTFLSNKVDVLRTNQIARLIFIKQQGKITVTNDQGASTINLYKLDNDFLFSPTTAITTFTDPDAQTRIYSPLSAGHYALFVDSSPSAATVTYQTDVFSCPSTVALSEDDYGNFESCGFQTLTSEYFLPGNINHYSSTYPRHALLNIGLREVIQIRMELNDQTGINPQNFQLDILASDGTVLPKQPLPFGVPTAVVPTLYETFWTAPYAGDFFIQVTTPDTLEAIQLYFLTVYRKNSGNTLVAAVDVLRGALQIVKYLHFSSTPASISLSHDGGNGNIALFSMNAGSILQLNPTTAIPPDGQPDASTNTYNTPSGYYMALFTMTAGTNEFISVETDPYPCPFQLDSALIYTDKYNVFQGCQTSGAFSPALPLPANPTIPVYGDSLLQLVSERDAKPRYHIGAVTTDERIYFQLNFTFPTGDTPSVFYLQLLSSPDTDTAPTVLPTQPSGFGPAFTYEIPLTEKIVYHIEWNVSISQNGQHIYVDVLRPGTEGVRSFVAYEIVVKKLTGSIFNTLTTGADILRNPTTTDYLYNLIYLSATSTIEIRNTLSIENIHLFPMRDSSTFLTDLPNTLTGVTSSTAGALVDNVITYSNLPAGFYGVRFTYYTTSGSASFQSHSYGCPVTKIYDISSRCAFDPCTGTMLFTGKINLHQAYVIQAHGCGSTQFYNGSCHNVDPARKCNTFNALLGDCTTCYNTKYRLISGWCVIPLNCSEGSILKGVVCVSDLCKEHDAQGLCTSCKSVLNEVKADGSCGPKRCVSPLTLNNKTGNCDKPSHSCEPGYFPIQEDCYLLPPHCVALSPLPFLTCEECEDGYTPEEGSCVEINGAGVRRVGGGAGTSSAPAPGGTRPVSFRNSAFFDHCADVDEDKLICNFCKPGFTFIRGNLCG